MNRHERGLEFKVGAFVFVGLSMLAALVVQFGRLGEGFKTYYPITVRFTDASGLLKGSDVLLAGARIGHVSGGPRLVREGHGVAVPLRIYDYVKIPKASKFEVGSSGLLGGSPVSACDRVTSCPVTSGGGGGPSRGGKLPRDCAVLSPSPVFPLFPSSFFAFVASGS